MVSGKERGRGIILVPDRVHEIAVDDIVAVIGIVVVDVEVEAGAEVVVEIVIVETRGAEAAAPVEAEAGASMTTRKKLVKTRELLEIPPSSIIPNFRKLLLG